MKKILTIILGTLLLGVSCNKDGVIEEEQPMAPEIILESTSYSLKAGQQITIAPQYRYAEGASYTWSIDGKVVGREASCTIAAAEAGRLFVSVQVTTKHGSDRKEVRIDVAELALPFITLPGAAVGFGVIAGEELEFAPTIAETGLPTSFTWSLKGPEADDYESVATEQTYTFAETLCGVYAMRFEARNEDGSDAVEFTVTVVLPEDAAFGWSFRQTEFNISSGRRIKLGPQSVANAFNALYTWSIDGSEVCEGAEPWFVFDLADEGRHEVEVRMKNSYTSATQTLVVNVCPPEGTYRRMAGAGSSARWSKVFEFTAAPGQYINENYSATTAAEACAYAEERLKQRYYVSLGAFGGYIVVGFDHSIANTGGYDFAVSGNSFDTSSEPGIVWVMQDENGNGLPDDTWYELAGSEAGREVREYAVTYHRPSSAGSDIPWTDNMGGSGKIARNAVHRQDYWPAWIDADSYTLWGTRLEDRSYDSSGNGSYWVRPPFEWGYADNFSPVDRLTDDDNPGGNANPNHFKISNAVDFEGRPAELKYIDFIKVQTGVLAASGQLGEFSTEVCDFCDCAVTLE